MIARKHVTLSLLAVFSVLSTSSTALPPPTTYTVTDPNYIPAPYVFRVFIFGGKIYDGKNDASRRTNRSSVASASVIGPAYSVYFGVQNGDIFPVGGKLQFIANFSAMTRYSKGHFAFGEPPETTPALPVQPDSFVIPLGGRGMVNADQYRYELTAIEHAKTADVDPAIPTATLHAWPKKCPIRSSVLSKHPDALAIKRIVKGDVLHVSNCKYDVLNVVAPDAETGVKGWVELGFRKFVELGR